jgi:hypothetical protein
MEKSMKFSQIYKHTKILMYIGGDKRLRKTWDFCIFNEGSGDMIVEMHYVSHFTVLKVNG